MCVRMCTNTHTSDNINCPNALAMPQEASYTAKPVRNYMLCPSEAVVHAADCELTQLL